MSKMKKYINLFLCAALALAACTPIKPNEQPADEYLGNKARVELSTSERIPAEGGTLVATVRRSPEFEISIPKNAEWLSCSQVDSVVTVKVSANTSAVARYARIGVIDKELQISVTSFEVIQNGSEKDVEPIKYKAFSAGPETITVAGKETATIISVTADDAVAWTVTSDNTAFVPNPTSGSGNATIKVSFPANTTKNEVKAAITVSTTSTEVRNNSYAISITQEPGAEVKPAVKPAPGTVLAEWYFCKAQTEALAAHFSEAVSDELADAPGNGGCYVEPNVSGKGRLEYYNGCDKAAAGVVDQAHKRCKRAVGSYGEPCPYGTYKDDYILWTAYTESEAPIAAGTKLHLFFALRPNKAFIMKYWLIEYLDGEEWKPALETKDGDGFKYNVELFFASGAGNETNTFIEPTVTLTKDTEAAKFRITAVSNIGADGTKVEVITAAGALRFSGEDCNANTPEYSVKRHPVIDVVQ